MTERKSTTMRDSNMELLRLISIFLVVLMHVHNEVLKNPSTWSDISYLSAVNSFANVGVSLFMLISGFYGIKAKGIKIWKLWSEVFFWGVIAFAVSVAMYGVPSAVKCLSVLLPISSGTMWFATGYMLIALFADPINGVAESLSKERFRNALILMFVVFCVLPSLVGVHISGANHGRTVANLFLAYMTGRYIRLHVRVSFSSCKLLLIFVCCALCVGISNAVLTALPLFSPAAGMLKNGTGVVMPFARNCSVFIFAESICLFLLFRNMRFSSRVVNAVSPYVFAVYLLDPVIRPLLFLHCDGIWTSCGCLKYPLAFLFACFICFAGISAGYLRRLVLGRLDDGIGRYIVGLCERARCAAVSFMEKRGL